MKKLLFLFSLSTRIILAQDFTGHITYLRRIIPNDSTVNVDSLLNTPLGDSAVYTISGDHYKSYFFYKGKPVSSYTYSHPEYRFYHEMANTNYISYSDSRKSTDTLQSFEIYRDTSLIVAGYTCFKAEKKFVTKNYISFYTNDIKINPETFKGHNSAGWYQDLQHAKGCLSIKSVTDHGKYIEVFEAIKIVRATVDEKFFNIPPHKLQVASYSILDIKPRLKRPSPKSQDCHLLKLGDAPNIYNRTRQFTSYILFVVKEDGKIEHISPYQKDDYGIYNVAIDIVRNCGFQFVPGQVEGKPVNSEFIMPLNFKI